MLLFLFLALPLSSAIEFSILVADRLHSMSPEAHYYHSLPLCQPGSGFNSLFDSLLEVKKFRTLYHFTILGSTAPLLTILRKQDT